jgi:hypothetical protein
MALTRITAQQISNLDYKQAVRVITVSNVTLSAGAPSTVDGVTLVLGDRILVAGQNTGSQNGIYYVTTLGTGANGTWTRTGDADTNGEIDAGMIVMVTEGSVYADTQWKLITNNPIVIGTTALVFEKNAAFGYSNVFANGTAVLATTVGDTLTLTAGNNISIVGNNATRTVTIGVTGVSLNSISNGTSNVNVVSLGGNVTVGVGGTSNVAVFSTSGLAVTGIVSATGNVTGGNLITAGLISATGNITGGNANIIGTTASTSRTTGALKVAGGIGVAGDLYAGNSVTVDGGAYGNVVATQFASLYATGAGANPYSIVQVRSNDGTTGMGMQAYANLNGLVYSNTGITFQTGTTIRDKDFPTGGATRLTIDSTGLVANGIVSASGNITGGNLITAGLISATGNATVGNITATIGTFTTFTSAQGGNVTGTLVATSANAQFINQTNPVGFLTAAGYASITGNVTGGNLITAGLITATGNVNTSAGVLATGNVTGGNINTAGLITATGNITGGNVNTARVVASSFVSAAGNVVGGNVNTAGLISATGNVSGGNLNLTGNIVDTGALTIITGASGNVSLAPNGTNVLVATTTGANITGTLNATGNANVGNLGATNIVGTTLTGTLQTAAQTNITSVGTLGSLSVTGNITGGNVLGGANVNATTHTGTTVSVTGTVTAATVNAATIGNTGAAFTGASISAATIGNTGALITGTLQTAAQTNITSVGTLGSLSVTGNVTGGNLISSALVQGVSVSASGNVTGGNLISSALVQGVSVSASGNVTGGNLITVGQISATGTITSNAATNSTAFAVGNSAVSNVALGMFPTAGQAGEYAIRDYSSVFTNMYLDVGMGGTANGAFQFRTSNAFRLLANINSSGITTPLAVSATGNVTGNFFIGNGSQLTGVVATVGNSIVNGTSNVVAAASGNVTVGVAGTAAVATFTTAGIIANSVATTNNGGAFNFKVGDDAWLGDINTADTIGIRGQQNNANGYIVFGNADSSTKLGRSGSGPLTYDAAFSAVGNVTGGNILTAGIMSSTGNGTHGNVITGGVVTATGNITGGNLVTAGLISATGNIIGNRIAVAAGTAAAPSVQFSNDIAADTGFYWISDGNIGVTTNGVLRATFNDAGVSVVGNVTGGNLITGGLISATGNITGGNISATNHTGTTVSVTGNITGGNLLTGGLISSTGNITGGNISATNYTGTTVSVTGNIAGGNVTTGGNVVATGNVSGGNVAASTTVFSFGNVQGVGNVIGGNITTAGQLVSSVATGTAPLVVTSTTLVPNLYVARANVSDYNVVTTATTGTYYPQIVNAVTGNVQTYANTNLSFNAATGVLTASGYTTTGTITAATVNAATIGNTGALITGTLQTAAQTNITSVGTLGSLSVTGNITGGNLLTSGNIVDTNALTIITGASGNVSLAPNGTNVLIATTTGANITGTLNATGNANVGNLGATNIVGTLTTASQTNITGVGNISTGTWSATAVGILYGGTGKTTAPAGMAALMGYTSTATAAGTTTLTNTSSYYQQFTGTSTQTVVLPVTSTLQTGWTFHIVNNSTGNLSVQSSGLNAVITIIPGTTSMVTCISTATTTAADWEAGLTDFSTYTGTGAVVLGTSPVLTTPNIGAATGTSLSTTGNITGGNLITAGVASATGNISTSNYFVGNGAFLTGISAAVSVTKIENGNSNVWVQTPGGDVTVTAGGVANVAVFSTGSLTLSGAFGTPKNITANVVVAGNINAMLIGPLTFADGVGLTVPNSSTVYVYSVTG